MKLLFVSLLLFTFQTQAAQLSVTGQCEKEVTPDRVSVVLGARVLEKDPKTASTKASAHYEKIKAELAKLKLKDYRFHTSSFSVNQEWEYANNKRTLKGYTAAVSITAETSEVARAGEMLDLATRLNVQEIGTPATFLSPELARKEYESCLDVAIKSAKSKAERMAAAAGLGVKFLVSLKETKDEPVHVPVERHSLMMKEESTGASFDSKPTTVQVTVYAAYEIK